MQMKDKAFIDTNVFVYLYSEDEIQKQKQAQDAIEKYECVTSTQMLNEFSNVCLKKLRIPTDIISNSIDEIADACGIILVDTEIIKSALNLQRKYGYSYYDCLVIASALSLNCKYLLTEDLSNLQLIENSLIILNIFEK